MKVSRIWIVGIAVLMTAFALILYRPVESERSPQTSNPRTTKGSIPLHADGAEIGSALSANMNDDRGATMPSQESQANEHDVKFNSALQQQNVAIDFWGRTVDQDDLPLPEVTITAHVRTWTSMQTGLSATHKLEVKTDNNGRFEIIRQRGDLLTIDGIQKAGYEPELEALQSFGFNTSEQFRANPDAPVLFRMWRTNTHEELITGKKAFRVVPDGRKYVIDLKSGSIAESGSGQLQVWIKRPSEITFGQKYDWSCELSVIGGGMLQVARVNSAMYLAPTNGYGQSSRFEQRMGSGWGDSTGPRRFYIMLEEGKIYGRLKVEMFANYNNQVGGLIRIEYALNPSGSRILR